jgi:ribonuclease G
MANNLLVINVDIRETRVALIENGIIVELHIERASEQRCLGNVALGRVTRVLPGMQAAFIDVGLEKAAFLHVEDLIRPDDFETYLAGGKKADREERDDEVDAQAAAEKAAENRPPEPAASGKIEAPPEEAEEGSEPEPAAAAGAAPARTGRRRRRRGSAEAAKAPEPPPKREVPKKAPPSSHGRREGRNELARLDKHTPIREVVREGQEVLVQISKEPIGTKGARVTSHISLPGRYVVYLPTVEYVGVSKRIGSEKERSRLRETIEGMKPPTGGLIIRTVAEGLTKKQLKADVGYLVRLWGEIVKKREGARAPSSLFEELDLTLKVARDMFGDEISKIVIDDKLQYERLTRFVEMFMPERVKDVELYQGDEPIFDAYGIEEEVTRALSRKVPLPSGGYLIIDEAEALTAIDVNTGRFVGKGSKDHEETILKTNLEAVEEIAYQLRFRNLGGLIVLDLIDMEKHSSREQVRRRLEELLQKDKAKTSLNRISDLGLIEMTRKRTRESLGRLMHDACPYCDGTGQVRSATTMVYEILRAIRRDRSGLPGYTIMVNAHPDVVALMKGEERAAVVEAERRYTRRIDLTPRKEYHLEQYDLTGR